MPKIYHPTKQQRNKDREVWHRKFLWLPKRSVLYHHSRENFIESQYLYFGFVYARLIREHWEFRTRY